MDNFNCLAVAVKPDPDISLTVIAISTPPSWGSPSQRGKLLILLRSYNFSLLQLTRCLHRRSKIAHDPRNLAWKEQAATSFGSRMMVKQGWTEGQSLGNRASSHLGINDVDRLAAARVGVLFKDNNLGLGAKTKSQDIEAQRTGLDAYQAMLGRLNGKSQVEVEVMEKKVEDRKLAMYAKGRWGGMVFIKGGTLVGEKTFGTSETVEEQKVDSTTATIDSGRDSDSAEGKEVKKDNSKEERRKRKGERRLRREAKAARRAAKAVKRQAKSQSTSSNERGSDSESADQTHSSHRSSRSHAPDEPVSSSSSGTEEAALSKLKRKRSTSSMNSPKPATPTTATPARGGRHLLRGRNIQAKRMAFTDLKGLDEIFMRPG